MYKGIFMALVVLAGAGCSSTEPVTKTYLLPDQNSELTMVFANKHQPVVIVRPVEVAEHLAGTGLVYQTSETEVVQAQQNLWAESLSRQLTRIVTEDLRQKQSRYWFDELTPAISSNSLPKLQVKFTQFNGHYSGLARLSGQWLLIDKQGEALARQPFSIQVPLEQDGYDAQVKALAEGVARLTNQISQSINGLTL
ncbi:PqiC family protein [Photobacterium satsumensis]|uniref:PqiC family protein n=1 Tax=Photobacterium satsumensis TaxID=2910239 RepID=UPI003D12DFC2